MPTPYNDPIKVARREARELRQYLRELTAETTGFLARLDEAMKGPSTFERGQKIARLAGLLEIANDRAKHFGLGLAFDDPAWRNPMMTAKARRKRKSKPATST